LILWDNYSIGLGERIVRQILFIMFAFLFLIFVFWSVTSLENENTKIDALTPKVICQANVTEESALIDYNINVVTKRTG
jgi:hypothetical protein